MNYDDDLKKLIPPGFDLNKYRGLSNANKNIWRVNLTSRQLVRMDINDKDYGKAEQRLLDNVQLGDVSSNLIVRDDDYIPIVKFEKDEDFKKYLKLSDTDKHFRARYWPLIQVDLNETDTLLVDEFKRWLEKTRLENNIKSTHVLSPARLKKLYQHRVLQYLDVYLWARLKGLKITQKQFGLIIFPDDRSGDQASLIRKNTVPTMIKSMNRLVNEVFFQINSN